jgi:acid stress-induced BolA-like protein IbaG/YrbA
MARAKLTQQRLKEVLTARLGLTSPRFMLETLPGGKVSGSVVSDSFAGMKDTERQRRIWAALDAEFGPQSTNLVGTLLAYADREWDWNTELATK